MDCCVSLCLSREKFYPLVYVPVWDLELPAPCLPSCPRSHIFRADRYTTIQHQATKAVPTRTLYGSFHTLARHLCRSATDDLGRLWAIYCWLTTLSPDHIQASDKQPPAENSPLEYLLMIKKKENLHSHLFAALSQAAGIPCVVIQGVTKNAGYQLGAKADHSKMASQWNAVFVQNEWRLVDTLWGSMCTTGKRSTEWAIVDADGDIMTGEEKLSDGKSRSDFNSFFFLTDPDMLICTHLPNDPAWQLLPSPVTAEDFTSLVYIREQFFHLNCALRFSERANLVLNTKNGKVVIDFGLPEKKSFAYDFKYLLFKDPSSCPVKNNADLQGTVYSEMNPDMLSYSIQFPAKGRFRFDIFGVDSRRQKRFDLVASYLIFCDSPSPDFEMLPDTPEIGWGPGLECRRMGLLPLTHQSGAIDVKDGRCQIRFQMKEQLTFGIEMKHNDMSPWELENNAVVRAENGELQVDVRMPKKGQYAVKLYAKTGDGPGKLNNVCNYLIRNQGVSSGPSSFPYIHNGIIGRNAHICEHFGIRSTSHTENLVVSKTADVPFGFEMKKDGVDLLAMLSGPKLATSKLSEMLSKERNKQQMIFHVKMVEYGEYTLNVYARESDSRLVYPAQSYMVVYDPDNNVDTKPVAFGPLSTTEPLYVNGSQMSTSHSTHHRELVRACVEKKFHSFPPGGSLDSSVDIRETGIGVNLAIDSLTSESTYRVDMYEETSHDSGFLLTKKSGRLVTTTEEELLGKQQAMEDSPVPEIDRPFNPVAMRARLKMVLICRTLKFADAALKKCRNYGYRDDDLVPRVEKLLEILHVQRNFSKALRKAMASGITGPLERSLEAVDELGLYKEMGFQVVVARRVLIKRLSEKIRKMDQTTVAEVKSYSAPPRAALQVMKASLLLLGHTEKELKDWESMRAVIGETQKMKQRLKEVDLDAIGTQTALEAERLITGFTHDDAQRVSDVVDAFYAWSRNMIKLKLN